ncbi:MAG TPA: hypothetical protein VGM94_17435 [Galbitalea sp.]|jgi:hypothetical protein
MKVRYRTTVVVNVPFVDLARFKTGVQRYAPNEHKSHHVEFSYASAVSDSARPISKVRVLVDSLGGDSEEDDAKEAGLDTAIRALVHVGATDLSDETTVEVIE